MAPSYVKIIPSLPVTSVPSAIAYYCDTLGFRVAGRDRDDHTWLQLAPEGDASVDKYQVAVNLYLRRRGFPDLAEDAAFGKVYVRIDGAEDELETLLATLKGRGAAVTDEITAKPWGLKDFTVRDPDGNLINFSQAIAGWRPPPRPEQ